MLILLTYPWEAVTSNESVHENIDSDTQRWCSHVLSTQNTEVINIATGATFPSQTINGLKKIFELHGPAVKGELSQKLTLGSEDEAPLSLEYDHNSDHGSRHANLEQFEPFFDQMMDSMLYVIREGLQIEKFKQANHLWADLFHILNQNDLDDPAKYALVVDLSRPKSLMEPLQRITDRPKRVLRRIHDQERVQKVREIDTKCMTDLAKRPGSVLAEKAGPKQRILAIRRTESIDILENRVARHCAELASRAAKRYLNKHVDVDPTKSERVRSVLKLQRRAKSIPRKESFLGVRRLLEPCRQPNYTLMQNADYFRVWQAYVELVRNEDLRNQLWMWNRRLWVDFTTIYLASAMQSLVDQLGAENIQMVGHKSVLTDRKHHSGEWLLKDSLPGPFIVEPDSKTPLSLYLFDGSHETLVSIDPDLGELSQLNADFLIVASRAGEQKVLPVYSILPSHHYDDRSHSMYLEKLMPSLMKNIRGFNEGDHLSKCVGGWVLLGNWSGREIIPSAKNMNMNMEYWMTSISPDTRKWNQESHHWEKPLLSICGI